MDVLNVANIPDEREWTVSFQVRKSSVKEIVRVNVVLTARDIHQAIEKACQYYAEADWIITDVVSYEI